MEETFAVTLNGHSVGTVHISREGLYCRVSCRCRVADDGIHRIYAGKEKLGVLIPENGALVLDTKVAAKRLKEGCAFTLDESGETFIPIRPGEPFEYLQSLRRGNLALRNGEAGLWVKQADNV